MTVLLSRSAALLVLLLLLVAATMSGASPARADDEVKVPNPLPCGIASDDCPEYLLVIKVP